MTCIENEIDDNGNTWGALCATKSKNIIKTRTAVDTCAKATPTKGQKVIENTKKQEKQTRQKSTVEKSTNMKKRQPNKKDVNNQNVKNDEQNNRLSSSTECSSTTSNSNNIGVTQTTNDVSGNNDNAPVTRQIPVVKSNKKGYLENPLDLRPSTHDPRPSTLIFFYRFNYKIWEPILSDCWLTVCDADLTSAERRVHVQGSGTIRNIIIPALDQVVDSTVRLP